MKRIPNKTAVMTICYGIPGLQSIAIYDYDSNYNLVNRIDRKLICKGKLMDLMRDYRYRKYFESEYHGMRIEDDNTIAFEVFTRWEEYK